MMKPDTFARQFRDGAYLVEVSILGAHTGEDGVNRLLDQVDLHRCNEVGSHYRQALGEGLAIVATEQEVDGGQHVFCREGIDDLSRLWFVHFGGAALVAAFGKTTARGLATQLASSVREILY